MTSTRTAFSEAAHRAAVAFSIPAAGTLSAKLAGLLERRDMFAEHLETFPVKYLGETWVITVAGSFVEFVQSYQYNRAVSVGLEEAKRFDQFAATAHAKPIPGAKAISLGDALRAEVTRLGALAAELEKLLTK